MLYKIGGLFGPFGLVLHPSERWAYVSNTGSNNFAPFGTRVAIVDLCKRRIRKQITTGIQPSGLALASDARTLYVSNFNSLYASPTTFENLTLGQGTVSVLAVSRTGKRAQVTKTLTVPASPSTLTLWKDTLYVCNYSPNSVTAVPLSEQNRAPEVKAVEAPSASYLEDESKRRNSRKRTKKERATRRSTRSSI
jgi:DNA-binding beta-propeller fold protein YncE